MKVFVIPKEIRETLNSKRKILSRKGVSTDNPYTPKSKKTKKQRLKAVSMTPYLYMYSEKGIQTEKVDKEKTLEKYKTMSGSQELYDKKTGEAKFVEKNTNYLKWEQNSFPVLLSNQEYEGGSKRNNYVMKNEDSSYKTIQYGYGMYNARGDRKFRPTAGIKGLSSEYFSSGQVSFVRQVTVNWTCFTLEDLDFLSERFMTLGRKVYVEWGNTAGLPKPPLVTDSNGQPNDLLVDDPIEIDKKTNKVKQINGRDPMTSAAKIQNAVLKKGKGNIDATIGYIDGFEFSQRDDGGFDCTTTLKVNGGSIFDTDSNVESQEQESKPKSDEDLKKEDASIALKETLPGFQATLQGLPYILNQYLDRWEFTRTGEARDKKRRNKVSLYDDYTTADSYTSEVKKKNWAGQMFTGGWFQEDKKYKRETTIEGLTTEDAYYMWNDNAICLVNKVARLDSYTITGHNAAYIGEGEDVNEGIDKTLNRARKRQDGNGLFHIEDKKETKINANECWVRWGWFEDNIINKYFALVDGKGDNIIQSFRSIKNADNPLSYGGSLSLKSDTDALEDYENEMAITQLRRDKSLLENYPAAFATTYAQTVNPIAGTLTKEGLGRIHIGATTAVVKNKVSTTTKSHKKFQTPDINTFLFPGHFELGGKEVKEKQKEYYTSGTLEGMEKQAKFDMEETLNQVSGSGVSTVSTKDLRDAIEKFRISTKNLDLKETGIIPYLKLAELENITKQINVMRPFSIEESFPSDDTAEQVGIGKIRNIFINVAKLQSIFENPTISLGENMKLLFNALKAETNGLMDLTLRMSEQGEASTEDVDDTSHYNDLIKAEENGEIYEFPVNTHDSFVESQEIASDIGSKMMQILLTQQYTKDTLKDEHGNILAQVRHDTNVEEAPPDEEPVSSVRTPANPPPQKKNLHFGQLDGNEDIPLRFAGEGEVMKDTTSPEAIEKFGKQEGESGEKDAEQGLAAFKKSDFAYDIDGKLKDTKKMFDEVSAKMSKEEKQELQEKTGNPDKYEPTKVDENAYGLLFITNTITISGVAGIRPGMLWTTSYLPKKFKDNAHFYTTNVSQTIDSSGWKTTITGRVNRRFVKIDKPKENNNGNNNA